jgi:hypothetical protein
MRNRNIVCWQKQLLKEDRQNPIVDQYREEKSVAKDGRGMGLPFPRQNFRALSGESLAKDRNQENRRHSQRYEKYPGEFLEKISTIPLSRSESDEESEKFYM